MAWPSEAAQQPQQPSGFAAQPQPAQVEAVDPTTLDPEFVGQKVLGWTASKAVAVEAVATEMEKRKELTALLFPNPTKGTQRYTFANGYKLKLVYKETASFVKLENLPGELVDQISNMEDAIEALGVEARLLCERLVKWKPELSESEFKKLDPKNPLHQRIIEILNTHIVTKPASPSLELEEPKAKP